LILTTRFLASFAARQAELDALRQAGIDIEIVQVDVADSDSMNELFMRFGKDGDLPPLRGIFHMAADIGSGAFSDIGLEHVELMFRAKVQGTLVLHECSRSQSLDFFVAFSSTSSVLGASHLGTYAAANSFLDAMASLRAAENLPFTSINWGTWQTMRLATSAAQQQFHSGGMLPMQDEAALGWLGALLEARQDPCPVVARVDWAVLAPLYESRRKRRWLEFVTPELPTVSSLLTPAWNPKPGESRLTALERAVQKEAARVLGFRRGELPGIHVRLADLGLDSLMAVNLRNRLQALIGHIIPPTFAFEHPTPAQMAMALDMILWSSGIEEDLSASDRDEIQL
jgi:acyl carrier protein